MKTSPLNCNVRFFAPRLLALAVACILAAFAQPQARAQIIYDNGAPNQASGNEMTQWIQAEDFTLSVARTVTSIHFWDLELPASGYQGSIFWAIYTNAGGSPGGILASGTQAAVTRTFIQGGVLGLYNEFSNSFNISGVALPAGTTFWLGLHNGPLTMQTRSEFYWESTNANATLPGHELIAPFTGAWAGNGVQHAFQLDGVPEPSTWALMGLGACGLLCVSLRRRAAQS